MVRAAATGVMDYTGADPRNTKWRIKHQLLLSEVARKENLSVLRDTYAHRLALLAHGNLTEDSFKQTKQETVELLSELRQITFPWAKTAAPSSTGQNDTIIDSETAELIERYKKMVADNN